MTAWKIVGLIQMKKNLNNWNKEGIEDQKIVDDLREYSNGAIDLKVENLRLNDQQRHNNNNNNQRKQNNQNNQRKTKKNAENDQCGSATADHQK